MKPHQLPAGLTRNLSALHQKIHRGWRTTSLITITVLAKEPAALGINGVYFANLQDKNRRGSKLKNERTVLYTLRYTSSTRVGVLKT